MAGAVAEQKEVSRIEKCPEPAARWYWKFCESGNNLRLSGGICTAQIAAAAAPLCL